MFDQTDSVLPVAISSTTAAPVSPFVPMDTTDSAAGAPAEEQRVPEEQMQCEMLDLSPEQVLLQPVRRFSLASFGPEMLRLARPRTPLVLKSVRF